jgi:hypothetical protein
MKMRLKACPRCQGDLLPDASDRDGRTYICLQCGVEIDRSAFAARMPVAGPALMAWTVLRQTA